MADIQPGTILDDRFEIAGVLGRGGMATVYLANDRLRGEHVALKVLHDHLADSPSMRARLRREVVASGRIRHPNALVARDIHEVDGHLVLSMPFHPGRTLDDYVSATHPLSSEALCRLGIGLAQALAAAHQEGIVHRDVTPTNILVDENGNPALTDFGLARLLDFHTATATGVMGTTGYAAPETYRGHRGDPRSDVYSLGAVLYLAASGKPPFDAPNAMGILEQQEAEAFVPLEQRRPDLPPAVCTLIDSMLRRDPRTRPQSAAEVARMLEAASSAAPLPLREERPAASRREPGTRPSATRNAPIKRGGSALPAEPATLSPREEREQDPSAVVQPERPLVLKPLPSGPWTVLVREHKRDEHRRNRLRRKYRRRRSRHHRRHRRPPVAGLPVVDEVWEGLKTVFSIPDVDGPEVALTQAVSREAGLPDDALTMPPAMLAKRFRLVAGVDEACAQRLVLAAREWGFRARLHDEVSEGPPFKSQKFGAGMAVALVILGLVFVDIPFPLMIVVLIALVVTFKRTNLSSGVHVNRYPLAFGRDLQPHLAPEYRARVRVALPQAGTGGAMAEEPTKDAVAGAEPMSGVKKALGREGAAPGRQGEEMLSEHGAEAPQEAPASSPIRETVERTNLLLNELEDVVEQRRPDLPEVVLEDLGRTISALRTQVTGLGEEAERLQRNLSTTDDDSEARAVARIEARLERLKTIQRAGATVDRDELSSLEHAVAEHRRTLETIESWESRSTRILARLLEIGATARQALSELAGGPSGPLPAEPTQDLIQRLRQESTAAAQALEEMARIQESARDPAARPGEDARLDDGDTRNRAAVQQRQHNRH